MPARSLLRQKSFLKIYWSLCTFTAVNPLIEANSVVINGASLTLFSIGRDLSGVARS